MEKEQRQELDTKILKKAKAYLNNVISMKKAQIYYDEDFVRDIYQMDEISEEDAEIIINKYKDIAFMLRYSYGYYRDNVENFDKELLRLNSVISTSLAVEKHIHDLSFSKDLSLKENEEKTKEYLEHLNKLLQIGDKEVPKIASEEQKNKIKSLQDDIVGIANNLLKGYNERIEAENKHDKIIKAQIKDAKLDEYYIGTLSKEKNLVLLIRSILLYLVSNDIAEGIRKSFFEKYEIKLNRKEPKEKDKLHCLNVTSYTYTTYKIAELMELSLFNNGKNIIDDIALNLFAILIDLENQTKKAKYKNAIKEHIQQASKEMDIENNKFHNFENCVTSHAEKVLQELRWCNIEQ